jgi:8-oxo-dGTP pyrophosphatase MutT (NUDIX family)
VRSVESEAREIQYAALPWRKAGHSLQILLITTRNTRRWIVPKGWPLAGCSPSESAAHEAMEEAGISGEVSAKALGSFTYDKRRKSGDVVRCEVHVFTMEVLHQRRTWAEKTARETRWCSVEEALTHVSEPGLRRVIGKFAKAVRKPHRAAHAIAAA